MIYSLHIPNSADRGRHRSHIAHTITEPQQLARLLPRKLAKSAERLHCAIVAQIRAGSLCATIQASPYICAHPITDPRERARHGACTICGEAGYGNCDGCEKKFI